MSYTRDELLAEREAQDKPLPGLPKYDCILNKPILKDPIPVAARCSTALFMPSWEQAKRKRDQSDSGDTYTSNDKKKPGSMNWKIVDNIIRKKARNMWLSSKCEEALIKNHDVDWGTDNWNNVLRKKLTSILNRIAPQNFTALSVEAVELNIYNMEKINMAVDIIHEKAVLEPIYIETYSDLCKVLCGIKLEEEPYPKVSLFRKTLLKRCQAEFFREIQLDDTMINPKHSEKEELHKMLYENKLRKMRRLGNVVFIGTLYVSQQMLSSKRILVSCLCNLLNMAGANSGYSERLDNESIECSVKLLATVGQKLESDSYDSEQKRNLFEKAFNQFKAFAAPDMRYPARIRFLVQDIVDMRENGWIPRRIEAKPQRIDTIHQEFAREEQEKKMEAAIAQQIRKTNRNKSRDHARIKKDGGDSRMSTSLLNQSSKKLNTGGEDSKRAADALIRDEFISIEPRDMKNTGADTSDEEEPWPSITKPEEKKPGRSNSAVEELYAVKSGNQVPR